MTKEEIWTDFGDVKGLEQYKGYQISNHIRFRNTRNGKMTILSQGNSNGYKLVTMRSIDNEYKHIGVHRLVAITYIPNPNNLPEINHIDENKSNNEVSNLEWCTRKHNMWHSLNLHPNRHVGIARKSNKFTEKEVIEIYGLLKENKLSLAEIALKYNVSQGHISNIQRCVAWTHVVNVLGGPLTDKIRVRLTEEEVIEIYGLLRENKLSLEEIALKYNTTKVNIQSIKNGHSWSHVTDNLEQLFTRKYKKLTEKEVIEIYHLLKTGMKPSKIAKIYGTTKSNILYIKCGKTWSHITNKLNESISQDQYQKINTTLIELTNNTNSWQVQNIDDWL